MDQDGNYELQVIDVHKRYEGKIGDRSDVPWVLQGVNLSVVENEFVCIVGYSGCGKSTLLNLVAGYIRPDRGEIRMKGQPIEGPSPDRGVVFQEYALFPWFTVLQNVAFGPTVRHFEKETALAVTRKYLELVRLRGIENEYPGELSGGMQQRVGIARTLANEPKLLLMDEPFGALDALTRESVRQELLRIWLELRPTVVFVTHSIPEAVYLADRIAVMGARSGTFKGIVSIKMPRPRDTRSVDFFKQVTEIEELLAKDAKEAGVLEEVLSGPSKAWE